MENDSVEISVLLRAIFEGLYFNFIVIVMLDSQMKTVKSSTTTGM